VMKKLLLTSATFAALVAGPATAADLARPVYRRPVVVAAPVYSWTGFYIGGNVGGSWGDARTDIAGNATTFERTGTAPFIFVNTPSSFADSQSQRLSGVIGGGQIGYNYQSSPVWMLGFEADIQGSGERGSNAVTDPVSGTVCFGVVAATNQCAQGSAIPINATAVTAYDAKIGWFGTVRGRLGVLVSDHVLLYGTGGLAYGRVEMSGATNVNGSVIVPPQVLPFAAPGTSTFSTSRINVGFAVGGGIEGKCAHWLPTGWTWKLEYLYVDLGSLDAVAAFPGAQPQGFTSPFSGTLTTHTHFVDNIVRVGLNYKFGNYYAPVVTK
jgi:outer membrane immunogenic protein